MLHLGRRLGEKIVISHPAGDITVVLQSTRRNFAVISIDAPQQVLIMRAEAVEQNDYENRN